MKLSEEQRTELIELRRSGKTYRWLGDHFHISDGTAWKICVSAAKPLGSGVIAEPSDQRGAKHSDPNLSEGDAQKQEG